MASGSYMICLMRGSLEAGACWIVACACAADARAMGLAPSIRTASAVRNINLLRPAPVSRNSLIAPPPEFLSYRHHSRVIGQVKSLLEPPPAAPHRPAAQPQAEDSGPIARPRLFRRRDGSWSPGSPGGSGGGLPASWAGP